MKCCFFFFFWYHLRTGVTFVYDFALKKHGFEFKGSGLQLSKMYERGHPEKRGGGVVVWQWVAGVCVWH